MSMGKNRNMGADNGFMGASLSAHSVTRIVCADAPQMRLVDLAFGLCSGLLRVPYMPPWQHALVGLGMRSSIRLAPCRLGDPRKADLLLRDV